MTAREFTRGVGLCTDWHHITRAALAGKKDGCEVMGPAEDRVSGVNHVADIYRLRNSSD